MEIKELAPGIGALSIDREEFKSSEEMFIFGIICVNKIGEKVTELLNESHYQRTEERCKEIVSHINEFYCQKAMPELLKRHREKPMTPSEVKVELDALSHHIYQLLRQRWSNREVTLH